MRIAVGSKNPLKLEAVESVVRKLHPEAEYFPVAVDSGVSPTPLSNEETIAGARRRAREALTIARADWGVGLEGGMARVGDRWFSGVWCVIWDGEKETTGGGVHFEIPESVCRGILKEGREMGDCMDELTGLKMTKRRMGAEGILTGGRIDRRRTFQNAVIYALAPYLRRPYYQKGLSGV